MPNGDAMYAFFARMYTTTSDHDVQRPKWMPITFFSDSLRESWPLRRTLARFLNYNVRSKNRTLRMKRAPRSTP